jgi:hypothetical protein
MKMDKFPEMAALGKESFEDDFTRPSGDIFNHGLSYYRAYLKLRDYTETSNPSYVCLVFAIETFLKCLETKRVYTKQDTYTEGLAIYNFRENPRSHKHDLEELFRKLSKQTQDNITSLYKNRFYGNFHEDLAAVSKGFIEWRYIYEGGVEVIYLSALENIGECLFGYSESVFKNT